MIHPSYVDLMKVMNSGVEFGRGTTQPLFHRNRRFERKMIIAGDEPLVEGAMERNWRFTAGVIRRKSKDYRR